ncbi:MAG: hypothetical protein IPF39_12060 [Comamonadaceae bacterium]|uniref:hypothetical protein n=1 Tax=Candidatus Skiveiella danica TaxID=3386177 RepID=UPI00390A7B23|nr:hypothetical protein [Comamonadaceae bacterium]
MTLKVEAACTAPRACGAHWRSDSRRDQAARDVEVFLPGSLPNDGKVIEDARSYE